jgi:3-hydroxyacyl-CoA dehydrogenase
MGEPLHIESRGAVRILRMDRPPANATGLPLRMALLAALHEAGADSGVGVLVLTGTGRFFSAGADIGELGTAENTMAPRLRDLCTALEASPKPVLAAINGYAYGGGCELALACASRIVAHGASIALPEVKLGLIPGAGGTQRLPKLVGRAAAREMILTGEPIDAARAVAIGLADRIAAEPFLEAAIEFSGQLLRRSDALKSAESTAGRAALRCIEASGHLSLAEGLRLEEELVNELIASPESKAKRAAFLAARK